MVSTIAAALQIKSELLWWSTFRKSVDSMSRGTEFADIDLCIDEFGKHVLVVNGRLDENSTWRYLHVPQHDESFLAVKMTTLSEPTHIRYFGFTRVQMTRSGETCYLCQHSAEARLDNPLHTITTYMQKFVHGELARQHYHIQLQHR